jgi:NADH:ubiquinone oxidoreductase subunit 5 (subunit L)/multisubunit Na+/H+ antiporter MnhA subunit
MGGLWEKVPVMGAVGLVFSMASLGLPGLGNFIAELLILIGAFKANILMSCLASLGLIAATVYSLRIVQKVFLGNKNTDWKMNDLTLREKVVSASLVVVIVWLGLFPKPVLETAKPALLKTLKNQKEITFQNSADNWGDPFLFLLPPSQPSPKGDGDRALRTCLVDRFSVVPGCSCGIFSPMGEIRKGVIKTRELIRI